MARIRIPCLVGKTNKAGITSWYWQPSKTLREAGWEPVSLGKDEGVAIAAARARNAEVERWKVAGDRPSHIQPRRVQGTLAALIDRYAREVLEAKDDAGKWHIARSTTKTYRTALRRLELWAGDKPLAFITPARVIALRRAMLQPRDRGGIGHDPAHKVLKMGRVLFRFAIECDLVEKGKNPFTEFGLAAPASREVIWSSPAREYMIHAAYDCGQPSIALAIMLGFAIGQREQDLLALTERHYVPIPEHKMQPEDYATLAALAPDNCPRGMRIRQQKTGAWVEVPIVGPVRWAVENNIDTARAGGTITLLLDDTRSTPDRAARYAGEAGQTRFQRDFAEIREWAIAAALFDGDEELATELATLQFRDLRRTCVVYLGELGMDAHLIAGVTGHDIDETQKILKTYMPRTTGRAARAIALASARENWQGRTEKASNN